MKDKSCAVLSRIAKRPHGTRKAGPVSTSSSNCCDLHDLIVPIFLGDLMFLLEDSFDSVEDRMRANEEELQQYLRRALPVSHTAQIKTGIDLA